MANRKLIVEIVGDTDSVEKAFRRTDAGSKKLDRSLNQTFRGAAVGTGVFRSLGRSVAFASGAFLGGAGLTKVLHDSIGEAQDAQVTQQKLAAQFRASGQDLSQYQGQIAATSKRLSQLAGIQDEEFTQAFTNAFRGTRNVTAALKVETVAADVAKGRNVELAAAGIALTKAYLGQTTALRRLGIQIPKNVKGMDALELVGRRFAGQAAAGTTASQRLKVALSETEETIGRALLPTVNKLTSAFAKWLNRPENQKKIQQETEKTVGFIGGLLHQVHRTGQEFKVWADRVNDVAQRSRDLNKQIEKTLGLTNQLTGGSGGGGDFLSPTVRPARESGGVAATVAVPPSRRTGLSAQLLRSQLALAKALTTATQADDRRVLVEQKRIIQAAIRLTTNLKKRRDLYNQLAGIQNQILSIDQKAQDDRDAATQNAKDAADARAAKAKALRDKILAAAKRQADAEKAQNQKELAAMNARENRLKDQIKAIQGRFQDQLDIARQGIGALFDGPVKADVNEAARRTLGLSGALALTAGKVIGDVLAQTAQSKKFQNEVNRIVKGSGLTKAGRQQLRTELTAAGVGSMANLEAVLSGGPGAIRRFGQAFAAREKQAAKIATVNMKSQLVVLTTDKIRLENLKHDIVIHHTTNLDGRRVAANTSKYQARAQRRTATQKTGRIVGLGPVVG